MNLTLQDLIDAAQNAAEGQTPAQAVADKLASAPAGTDVDALMTEAIASFEKLREGGVATDEELAAVEALADVTEGARTELARRDQLAAERQAKIDELARRVKPEPASDGEDTGAPEAEDGKGDAAATGDESKDGGEPSAETTDPVSAADPAPAPAADPAPAPAADPAPAPVADAAPAAVAASAAPRRRVRLADLPQRETRRPEPEPSGVVITAAAEVEGYAAGARMGSLADVARAGTAKFDAFPRYPSGEPTRLSAGIARFALPFPDDLVTSRPTDDEAAIERAVDQKRLPEKSLVAAGGWCSPSERMYEMSPILADGSAGLIDIPEVQSPRGGLIWTEGPDYTAIWNGTGWIQTEEQAIAGSGFTTPIGGTVAGTTKPTFRVPCPTTWQEERAEAVGLSITGGILQNDSYTELTEDVIAHSLIAHAHRVNARSINRMVSEAGGAVTINLGPSATPSVLNSVDAQITDIRYLNRMGDNVTLEVMIPIWLKPVIRADQAVRAGSTTTEAYEVTDQKIDAWFRARNAVPHWVFDWQDAFTTNPASGFGGASPITSWPDSVDILVYIAGTYLRSRGDVITMNAVYDTTNLHTNDVLHLFVEEKLLVIKRRYKPRLLRIALSASGTTGLGQVLDSDGKVVVAP
ncbi:major capsid protein [Nocardia farcinica]